MSGLLLVCDAAMVFLAQSLFTSPWLLVPRTLETLSGQVFFARGPRVSSNGLRVADAGEF